MTESKNLGERLKSRLSLPDDQLAHIVSIIEKYGLKITIRNFDSYGILLKDLRGKTVRICHGTKNQSLIHVDDPHSVIAIVYTNGILSGWIETSKMEDIGDMMLIDVRSLHSMPEEFVFIQECPHMDVFGGFTNNGDSWICAKCKEQLVFNDK